MKRWIHAKEDFVVDYDLAYLDNPDKWERAERRRKARELADEEDFYDLEHGEGEYEDVAGGCHSNKPSKK